MSNATLYTNSKPTGEIGCRKCGGSGYYVRNVPVIHPDFGKAVKCECWRDPKSVTNQERWEVRG